MGNSAKGWAVCAPDGSPLVNTVADTRRAALVNWLVTGTGHMVFTTTTDAKIEQMWATQKHVHQVEVREVEVVAVQESQDV